jgi:hypothetical protein
MPLLLFIVSPLNIVVMEQLEKKTKQVIEDVRHLFALCDTYEKLLFVSNLINPAMDELMEQIDVAS